MISRLKRKFILLTLSALVALLTIMALGMNIVNYTAVVNESASVVAGNDKAHAFNGISEGLELMNSIIFHDLPPNVK